MAGARAPYMHHFCYIFLLVLDLGNFHRGVIGCVLECRRGPSVIQVGGRCGMKNDFVQVARIP